MKELDTGHIYLITGAAGFIGMHLAKAMLDKGCHVVGYDSMNYYYDIALKEKRLEVLNKYSRFKFYKAALENKETLFNVVRDNSIDVVINLAAQAGVRYSIENPDVYVQSNVVGFLNILEVCRHNKVKHLVYASSSSVYGANTKVPFSVEERVDNPVSLYAATKKANELMAYTYSHLYKIPTTGLRFFTVYGPYGRPDMAYYSFTKAIFEGKPIKVFNNGDMYRDFTYVDDVVAGVMTLLNNSPALSSIEPPYKLYNIGNNKPVKLADFVAVLEKCIGREAIKEYHPMQQGDVYQTYADVDELIRDVGFKPNTPIEVGLQMFVEWYKAVYRGIC